MLEILLIRHGETDWNRDRRIMGRRPVSLNVRGRRESTAIARVLKGIRLDAIWTSPVLRAVETARRIARGRKMRLRLAPEMAEIDYGEWVGKTFDEVMGEEAYKVYHTTPHRARAPGGEKIAEVQRRAVRFIEGLRRRGGGRRGGKGRIAVVSHADVIKLVLIRYLGLPADGMFRLRIDNSSISLLWFNGTRERVLAVNCPPSPKGLFVRTDQLPPVLGRKKG